MFYRYQSHYLLTFKNVTSRDVTVTARDVTCRHDFFSKFFKFFLIQTFFFYFFVNLQWCDPCCNLTSIDDDRQLPSIDDDRQLIFAFSAIHWRTVIRNLGRHATPLKMFCQIRSATAAIKLLGFLNLVKKI
jgi:hypothetical protein